MNILPKYYLGHNMEQSGDAIQSKDEIGQHYIITENVATIPFVTVNTYHAIDYTSKRKDAVVSEHLPWRRVAQVSDTIAQLLFETIEHHALKSFSILYLRVKKMKPKWYTPTFVCELLSSCLLHNSFSEKALKVAYVLAQDITPEAKEKKMNEAVWYAFQEGLYDLVLHLVLQGADLCVLNQNGEPLWAFLPQQFPQVPLNDLVSRIPLKESSEKLFCALVKHNHFHEANTLFERAAKENFACWKGGCKAAFRSVAQAATETIRVSDQSKRGEASASECCTRFKEALLPHVQNQATLFCLVKDQNLQVVQEFLRYAQAQNSPWLTPEVYAHAFCLAAEKENCALAREFHLHMQCDYVYAKTGRTPLQYAAENKWKDVIALILGRGVRCADSKIVEGIGKDVLGTIVNELPLELLSPKNFIQLFCDLEKLSIHHCYERLKKEVPYWLEKDQEARTWLFSAYAYFGYHQEAYRLLDTIDVKLPTPMLDNYSPLLCAVVGKNISLVQALVQRFALMVAEENALEHIVHTFPLSEVENLMCYVPQASLELYAILNYLITNSKESVAQHLLKHLSPKQQLVGLTPLQAISLFFLAAHLRLKDAAQMLWPWTNSSQRDEYGNSSFFWAVELGFDPALFVSRLTLQDLCATNTRGACLFALLLNRDIIPVNNPCFMKILAVCKITDKLLVSIGTSGVAITNFITSIINSSSEEIVTRVLLAFLIYDEKALKTLFRMLNKLDRINLIDQIVRVVGVNIRKELVNYAFSIKKSHYEAFDFNPVTMELPCSSITMQELPWVYSSYAPKPRKEQYLEIQKYAHGTHPVFAPSDDLVKDRYQSVSRALFCATLSLLVEQLNEQKEIYTDKTVQEIVAIDSEAFAISITVQDLFYGLQYWGALGIEKLFSFTVQAYISIVQQNKLHTDFVFSLKLAQLREKAIANMQKKNMCLSSLMLEGQVVAFKTQECDCLYQEEEQFLKEYTPGQIFSELQGSVQRGFGTTSVETWVAKIPHEDWKAMHYKKIMENIDAIWKKKQQGRNEFICAELKKINIPITKQKIVYEDLRNQIKKALSRDDYFISRNVQIIPEKKTIALSTYPQLSYLVEQGILE